MSSALSTLNTTTEVRPLSKAPNPQLLPGRRSINDCPLLWMCLRCVCVCVFVCSLLTAVCVCVCVCVHLDGLNAEHKFRVWVTILGHTSRPFFPFLSKQCVHAYCNTLIITLILNKFSAVITRAKLILLQPVQKRHKNSSCQQASTHSLMQQFTYVNCKKYI